MNRNLWVYSWVVIMAILVGCSQSATTTGSLSSTLSSASSGGPSSSPVPVPTASATPVPNPSPNPTPNVTPSPTAPSATPKPSPSPVQTPTPSPTVGTQVTQCGTLSTAGNYTLQNNVSSTGTCFTISVPGVSLNLNGHTITYNSSPQTAVVHAISCPGYSCNNISIFNGSIIEGSNSAGQGSNVIDFPSGSSTGPNIYNMNITWSSPQSQGISIAWAPINGELIYNNVLNNNTNYPCAAIGCRDQLQASSIDIGRLTSLDSAPVQIYSNTINGGPDGGIVCASPGCLIHDNVIDPGNAAISYSNDFAIWCWDSCDAYNNTIMTPMSGSEAARGVEISGVVCEAFGEPGCAGRNVHNNTITVIEHANNLEYNGCPLGGSYGIQFDDTPANATAQNNSVVAIAQDCIGEALRITDSETITNVSQNNVYLAEKASSGVVPCNPGPDDGTSGCAFALGFDMSSAGAFTSKNDSFQGDSAEIFLGDGGSWNTTLYSPTFSAGTNPDKLCNGAECFIMARLWGSQTNLHIQDPTFIGINPDNINIPAKDGESNDNGSASVFIDWTQTVTVKKASGALASGATVTFTDALGNTYSGVANSSGVATVVVTQKRYNNDTAASQIENRGPFNRGVSASGCTTSSVGSISVSATGSVTVTLSGC